MSERKILSISNSPGPVAKAISSQGAVAAQSAPAAPSTQQQAWTFAAKPGDILICEFGPDPADPATYPLAQGPVSVPPEMVKRRHVVVVSTPTPQTCVVAPFSTQQPNPMKAYHLEIPDGTYPFFNATSWLKGDMLMAVSRNRLDRPFYDGRHQRSQLSKVHFKAVRAAILNALGLGTLCQHLF